MIIDKEASDSLSSIAEELALVTYALEYAGTELESILREDKHTPTLLAIQGASSCMQEVTKKLVKIVYTSLEPAPAPKQKIQSKGVAALIPTEEESK